jgi:DNA modification methylase
VIQANSIHQGDVLDVLFPWPNAFVQTIVTSPPYWGLRDYGMADQIGMEASPAQYIERMVSVFRELRRVLRDDGTVWLNLGDSYAVSGKGGGGSFDAERRGWQQIKGKRLDRGTGRWGGGARPAEGLKAKDLVGIPWRVALALQADGWYLRSDIIWSKPNPMPESVMDRPTKAHEYIFLLSKSERYYYDAAAIREPMKLSSINRLSQDVDAQNGSARANGGEKSNGHMKAVARGDKQRGHSRRHAGFNDRWDSMTREEQMALGANRRSVWSIPTKGFPEAHFATFPEDIPTLCIKAGSRIGDVVLDPFMGAGTTAVVAKRLSRPWLGIELNPAYIEIAQRRIEREPECLIAEGNRAG